MSARHTLVINGKVYDAVTGLPVAAPSPVTRPISRPQPVPGTLMDMTAARPAASKRSPLHATQAHMITKKSATLRRDVLKKPVAKPQIGAARRKPAPGHVARSEHISRFAPHPQPIASSPTARPVIKSSPDIMPAKAAPAAIVAQKHALVSQPRPARTQPALSTRSVKEQLISERLAAVATTPSKPAKAPRQPHGFSARQPRLASLLTASFAVMVLGGYLTYLNMPGLSVRVAAAQAGVAASFPDYHPDGYRFSGPVAYAPGQVAINFVANGGTGAYTVTEQKSTWDSQAVYDNVVAKAADNNYVTNSQQGLTIYTFEGEAAWVNKGILYTVSGDAPLNNEQLLRIAASL